MSAVFLNRFDVSAAPPAGFFSPLAASAIPDAISVTPFALSATAGAVSVTPLAPSATTETVSTTDSLNDLADAVDTRLQARAALTTQIQTKTIDIRNARTALEAALRQDADYVDTASGGDAEKIRSAGMRVADDPAPVGDMPKVTRLAASAGDGDGEVDLHWDPVRRGLKSYVIERTTDPAGQTGWGNGQVVTKSRAEVTGLQSGTRYWFRAAAVGSAGQGPWSDPATKVAP